MSCSDLRLKTLRWFFMRSTTLLKSSWSSANICFTWRNRGRQGGKENGRVEKGRERKSRDGRWTGQADPTWYPYRFPTMYIPTVAVVLQSESIAQSPGLNALATSVGAPWSQVRWSWKLTSELHWSCGIPRGQRGDYRRQGKRMKEGRWRGKDEGKRMKGEDEGEKIMKGEDEGERMKGRGWREKMKGRRWREEDEGRRWRGENNEGETKEKREKRRKGVRGGEEGDKGWRGKKIESQWSHTVTDSMAYTAAFCSLLIPNTIACCSNSFSATSLRLASHQCW